MEKQILTTKDPAPLLVAIRKPSTGFVVIATILVFMLSVIVFAFATLASQRDHDKRFALAQRQVNGDQAMIYAVCTAFHKRDLSDAKKWAALTRIELHFKRPNNNAIDAAYHFA